MKAKYLRLLVTFCLAFELVACSGGSKSSDEDAIETDPKITDSRQKLPGSEPGDGPDGELGGLKEEPKAENENESASESKRKAVATASEVEKAEEAAKEATQNEDTQKKVAFTEARNAENRRLADMGIRRDQAVAEIPEESMRALEIAREYAAQLHAEPGVEPTVAIEHTGSGVQISQCGSLTPEQRRALLAEGERVAELPAGERDEERRSVLDLSVGNIRNVTVQELRALRGDQLTVLSAEQVKALAGGDSRAGLRNLTEEQLLFVRADAFSQLRDLVLSEQFHALSLEQIEVLVRRGGSIENHLSSYIKKVYPNAFTPEGQSIRKFTLDEVVGDNRIPILTVREVAGFDGPTLRNLFVFANRMSPNQIGAIPVAHMDQFYSFSVLDRARLQAFSPAQIAEVTLDQMLYFPACQLAMLTPDQKRAIPRRTLALLSDEQYNAVYGALTYGTARWVWWNRDRVRREAAEAENERSRTSIALALS